jgi:hypothetical protein
MGGRYKSPGGAAVMTELNAPLPVEVVRSVIVN